MDSITDKRIGTDGWTASRTGKDTLPGAGPESASGGELEDEQARVEFNAKRQVLAIPCRINNLILMSKEVQRESFIVSRT